MTDAPEDPQVSAIEPSAAESPHVLEELADDMLEVLRRLRALEQGQTEIKERLAQVDARVFESTRAIAHEMDQQRRDLLAERKSLLARSLFNAVVAHVDGLRAMRAGLEDGKRHRDKQTNRMIRQLEAIELSLITALQGFGYREFRAEVGHPFTPTTMECVGYANGQPGVVVQAVRTGFLAPDGGVARPAGVLLTAPSTAAASQRATT